MNSDERLADVARQSLIGRSVLRALAGLRADARGSAIGKALDGFRTHTDRLTSSERLRLTGVFIVTAVATNAVLLQWSPPIIRPAAPFLLSVVAVSIGVTLIVLAERLAHAWDRSWIRRRILRPPGSNTVHRGRA
jgi:hypothetical protein